MVAAARSTLTDMRSFIEGVAWPALPSPRGAQLLALLYQMELSQWWPPEHLLERQLQQLQALLAHACTTVPYYRERLKPAGYRPGERLTLDEWCRLPLLGRRDIQNAGQALVSEAPPAQFGTTFEKHTSGATGEPVRICATQLDQLIWEANTLREHLWHRRDWRAKLASIRIFPRETGVPPQGALLPNWGPPAGEVFVTGPLAVLDLNTDIALQAEWLQRELPDYLLTYPNNLKALIEHCTRQGLRPPRLRSVRTVGETLTDDLRELCRARWDVEIVDTYSSQEFGYIALQCPASDLYHVISESVLVEVLRPDGTPCVAGETGRLVVSSLHNFAMPLIRYELRDYATVGEPCSCGRGLPTLRRIMGRSRNLLRLPDGNTHWPMVGFHGFRDIAPIRQYQLIQHTLEEIEVRLVADSTLSMSQESQITEVICKALGHPFRLRYTYFERELPRPPNGKFEEFVCRIET